MTQTKYRAFIARARKSLDYWMHAAIGDFTDDIAARMKERGVSQAALAKRLKHSDAYISKVMRGSENLSIKTMAKLAMAVGGKVRIHIADLESQTVWRDIYTNNNYDKARFKDPALQTAQGVALSYSGSTNIERNDLTVTDAAS